MDFEKNAARFFIWSSSTGDGQFLGLAFVYFIADLAWYLQLFLISLFYGFLFNHFTCCDRKVYMQRRIYLKCSHY